MTLVRTELESDAERKARHEREEREALIRENERLKARLDNIQKMASKDEPNA